MSDLQISRRGMLSLSAAATLAACAPKPATGPIRIGFQRSGVLLLAKSRGVVDAMLKSKGPGVQWIEFAAGPPLMEAMAAGAVDLGAVGDAPPIFAAAAAAPIVYAAAQPVTGAGSALLVPAHSTINSVAELKGRRVAFTKASSAHLFIVQALRQAQLSLRDIQPIHLSPGDAAGAFASGSIDAWATWDPYFALAQRDQKARVLVTGEALPHSSAFYMANSRFAQQRPRDLSMLLDALRLEAAWAEEHRDAVAQVVSQATGLPQDIVKSSLRRGRYAVEPMTPEIVAQQQASADLFRNLGAIPDRIEISTEVWRGWKPA